MRVSGAIPERVVVAYEDALGNPVDVSATTALPVTGGGGGGGGSLSDTVFVDSTGQLFVYRDTGSGTPSAFAVPSWASYTPVGTVSVPSDSVNELLLTRALNYLNAPQGYDKSLQAMRITGTLPTVTTVTTVSTVTTCSTVTNLSTIDTLQGRIQVYGQNLAGWAATVRARIT